MDKKACTFFGHRDCTESVKQKLKHVLRMIVVEYGVTMFYIGNQGRFDEYARSVVCELKNEYDYIDYAVVLAIISSIMSAHISTS